jgi:hypothetical protein
VESGISQGSEFALMVGMEGETAQSTTTQRRKSASTKKVRNKSFVSVRLQSAS